MQADPKIVEDLNTMAQMLAHLAGQFQIDKINVKRFGVDWLSDKICKWYKKSECHLRIVVERLFYFGEDVEYDAGVTSGGSDTLSDILTRANKMAYATLDFAEGARRRAWDIRADYTPDVYEHIIEDVEKIAFQTEQQLNLIKVQGEPAYIGSRLEDE